jgi:phage internal scaffolding protein
MTKSQNTLPLFRTAYDGLQAQFSDETGTSFLYDLDDPDFHPSRSLTVQSDAEDLDINNIMARYLKTGQVPASRLQPFYGDASALPSYQEAQQILIDANLAFEGLPANIRDYFHNDPERMLSFLGDPANKSEARRLGLLEPEAPAAVAERPQKAGEAKAAPAPSEGQE